LRALARLCDAPEHSSALQREGALGVLLELLEQAVAANDERAMHHAAVALGALTVAPEVQLEVAQREAVPALVRLARSRDADTQRHAARAIGHLAGNAMCQKQIGQAGGLRPLIKCGYSRSADLQGLVVRAVANLALEPALNTALEQAGGPQLLLTLLRSPAPEVVHWAHVAQGNLEAASALGPLIRYCTIDNVVEPVDMLTMSALVSHLRFSDGHLASSVGRLAAAAVANLLVSAHNQRLLLECNGVKPIVALAHDAVESALQGQCMRAIANLAVTPEYRTNLLQARVMPILVGTLKQAELLEGGNHTLALLTHASRALGNMCADGEVAAAMQQKAANEGAITVLLPLLERAREHLQDLFRACVMDQVQAMDDLMRELARALSKLAPLKANQRAMVESEALHLVVAMISAETDRNLAVSLGVKLECLELLGRLADVPQCLTILVSDGALRSLIVLLHMPDTAIETAAAELLAKLAQVKEYQQQIAFAETLPLLVDLLRKPSAAAQLAGLHALNELTFDTHEAQLVALQAGVVVPVVELARCEDATINSNAATFLCQIVLAEAAGQTHPKPQQQPSIRLLPEERLAILAAMAMSSNAEAHAVAAMGFATLANATKANLPQIARVALNALVRLGRSPKIDAQAAALDAIAVLSELPSVQVDLVRMGALRMLLDRAATAGQVNADIRLLALTILQQLASNGANMTALCSAEMRNALRGLAHSMTDEPIVVRAVDAVECSLSIVSSLLELQGKQRALAKGDVATMSQCVAVAGVDSSIAREVGHTCAAVGAQHANVDLFVAEGGVELLNSLARSHSAVVQVECAQAFGALCRARDTHRAIHKQGGFVSLVHMARSHQPELQSHVATTFSILADEEAPKTWLVQSGCMPFLFAFIRNGRPEVRYLAAKTILYMK